MKITKACAPNQLILMLAFGGGLLGQCSAVSIQVSGFRLRSTSQHDGSSKKPTSKRTTSYSPPVSDQEDNLHTLDTLGEQESWSGLMDNAIEQDNQEALIAGHDQSTTRAEIEVDAQTEAAFLESITANIMEGQFELSFDTHPPSGSNSPSLAPTSPVPPSSPTIPIVPTGSPSASHVPTPPPTVTDLPTQTSVPSTSRAPSQAPTKSHGPTRSTVPTKSPDSTNLPTIINHLTTVPTSNIPGSFEPTNPTTNTPSISQPSRTPSLSSSTDSPSTPSTTPKPTLSADDIVFRCTSEGVELATPPFDPVTEIPISVGYLVESLFFTSEFLPDLHLAILEASVVNALQCNDDEGNLFGPNGTIPFVSIETTFTGESCTPQETICTILQTDFHFWVEEQVNPEAAAFLSYVALQEDVDGGIMASQIPQVDRMQYLSPLPLLPPIADDDDDDPNLIIADRDNVTVSPFTIGAVVTMSIGGLLALWAWARNRHTRNNRHMHLLENMSLESPDESL
mmetsp:Transcript_10732/g.29582  ORF Transcript_10732/g.29582 Transcript_10732/m.29582 type:complete len:510 (+) Transcript_10732:516-2045(+)|eukprot:CAMPEP_0168737244 /NCGR_PEP_ID=MMETSP0724-20121128/10290_1 /TAXON_ID=265536 /ORGANISM="Amphiprora sp., Strain CCMP467" /LENGTH=509 /DNA_ID=CAMNT_0008784495 /DNA_START=399 /DNA_END=1928 /DNA_ORIENTATION=-